MIYPLAPKPKQKSTVAAAEEGFLPEEVDSWEAEGVSPEELDGMAAPKPAAPAKRAPKDSFETNDYNYFTNQNGERQRRKLDWQDRTAGAVLGALEAPLFGANDEVVGAASAGLEQAQEFFGLMPKGYKARTVAEGIKRAQDLKNNYAKARETGEIGFWDGDNVASNAAGLAGSIWGFDKLYKGAKGAADVAQQVITKSKAVSGADKLYNAIYGLAGSGALGSQLFETFTPDGNVEERLQHLKEVGAAPAMMGAAFGLGGGVVGKGIGAGGSAAIKQMSPAVSRAARRLAEILNDADLTPQEIAESHAKNTAIKPDATLAEAGPDWFRGWQSEAGVSARAQGSKDIAAKTLLDRQRGSTRRIEEDIVQGFGGGGAFKTTFDGLKKTAQEAAKPLYDKAYAKPPLMSPELFQMVNSPAGKKMAQAAQKIMEVDPEISGNLPVIPKDAAGNIIGYPTQLLDYMKRGMDDIIHASYSGSKPKPQLGDAYKNFRDKFLGIVDNLNEDFAKARAAYAGPMATRTALEKGYEMAMRPKEEIIEHMAKLNPSELEFFKRGFAQNWINTMRKTPHGANAGGKLLNNNMKEDAARAVLGDEGFAKLKERSTLEGRMTDSFNEVYGNSKTAERLQAAEDSRAQSAEEMFSVSFAPAEPTQWIRARGMNWIAEKLRGFDKAKRAEISRMLFSRNKDEAAEAIKLIEANMEYARQRAAASRSFTGTGGITAGGTQTTGAGANVSNLSEEQGF
jgi:hypothetical protein